MLAHAFNQMARGPADVLRRARAAGRATAPQQLEQRSEQLEATNRELSDFLYVASHDLRVAAHQPRRLLARLAGQHRRPRRRRWSSPRTQRHGATATATDTPTPQWPALKEEIDESLDFILRSVAKMDVLVNALARAVAHRNPPARASSPSTPRSWSRRSSAPSTTRSPRSRSPSPTGHAAGGDRRSGAHQSGLQQPHRQRDQVHAAAPGTRASTSAVRSSGDEYRFFVRDTGPGIRARGSATRSSASSRAWAATASPATASAWPR